MAEKSFTSAGLESLESHVLLPFVAEHYLGMKRGEQSLPRHLARSIEAAAGRLSDSFTAAREELRRGYLRSKEERAAYILYFHLSSAIRIYSAMEEMALRGLWPQRGLRVLDLGAGTAPGLWAAAVAAKEFGGELSEVWAADSERTVLRDATALWLSLHEHWKRPPPPIHTREINLTGPVVESVSRESFDLVIVSNVLNELRMFGEGKQLPQLRRFLLSLVAPNGHLILLDPALQRSARGLTQFRDDWLKEADVSMVIPCGHDGKCPLNREPRDWCHFERRWEAPPMRKRLESVMSHASGVLKYSYLVVTHASKKKEWPEMYRLLSGSLKGREGASVLLCTPPRKTALRALSKDKEGIKILSRLSRGGVIRTEPDIRDLKKVIDGYAQVVQLAGLKLLPTGPDKL